MPVPGYDVRVVDADGTELKPGETGEIVVKLPLPLGCLPTLWRDDQRFVSSYLSQHPASTPPPTAGTATPTATCT